MPLFRSLCNVGQAPRDLAGHEGLPSTRALVVEEDSVAGVHPVGLAIVHGDPVGIELRDGIGAARVERRGLALRHFLHERSEEHTSELQSLMRISYAVFCLKKKINKTEVQRVTRRARYIDTSNI